MMSSAQIQKHQLPSAIETLAKVEQIIEEVRDHQQIPEELYGNILVSISKAVNNAIKHGNKLDPEKIIDISLEFSDHELSFTIQDQGKGFDFNNVPDPTHPDNIDKPDGRGIFIMKNLSDEVEFTEEGRIVKLKFNR